MVSKSWCFTLNNYVPEDMHLFEDLEKSYLIYGKEVGEEGTPHLQGFITFRKARRLSALKVIHPRVHWEIAKDREAAINYCMKDKDYLIQDNRTQGYRTDLQTVVHKIHQTGKLCLDGLEDMTTYVKFHQGLEKLIVRMQKPRTQKPMVTWIYGITGVGKTRYVVDLEPSLWISQRNLQWWEGYENQEAVLIDEFRKDYCTFHELLRILDRYPYRVMIKGGSRELNSARIYITSCHHPSYVYDTREDIDQLLRRIDEIKKITF